MNQNLIIFTPVKTFETSFARCWQFCSRSEMLNKRWYAQYRNTYTNQSSRTDAYTYLLLCWLFVSLLWYKYHVSLVLCAGTFPCLFNADCKAGLILGLRPASERRHYFVTTSLIGWSKPRISPVKLRKDSGIGAGSAHGDIQDNRNGTEQEYAECLCQKWYEAAHLKANPSRTMWIWLDV